MTAAAIAAFILQFGPSALAALPVLQKLFTDIKAGLGEKEVTPEYWAEINRLGAQSAEDIYRRLGIVPPPPAPAP